MNGTKATVPKSAVITGDMVKPEWVVMLPVLGSVVPHRAIGLIVGHAGQGVAVNTVTGERLSVVVLRAEDIEING